MSVLMNQPTLTSRILKTELVEWRKLKFIQQDDFKELDLTAQGRLKTSILSNNFTQPFYVWQDPQTDDIYCLDGKHRTIILEILIAEGANVPDLLPATFIHCESKQEAASLVLIYSSIYAKVTQQGLFDFIQMYDLEYDSIKNQMDIPELSMDRFEQKFDFFNVDENEEEEILEEKDIVVKPGDLFEVNGHRLFCGSFKDSEGVKQLMDGKKARILNCDPPYNLPTGFFSGNKEHTDFAMGAGEMTDEEFVQFLSAIMQTGLDNTLPGSIHYIFMDWRHVWHMTEAGRRVYGSPQPKQICVWNKDMMANGSFYRAKHEICFVFNDPKAKSLWNKDLADFGGNYKDNNELVFIFKAGEEKVKHLSHLDLKDRIRTNIWNYPSATSLANPDRYELKNHPTPKPVQMIADAILDTTNEHELVIDWFLGSGTCLMACEHTKRFCRATDVEPKYIQSAITRFIKYCAKKEIDVNFHHLNGALTIKDFQYEQYSN